MKTILKTKLLSLFFLYFISTQAQCVDTFVSVGNANIILRTDGTLMGVGANDLGQLGNGTTNNISTLTQIGTDNDWTNAGICINSNLFIKTNGTMWVWGHNNKGQLGLGNYINQLYPVQMGTDNNWAKFSTTGNFTAATKTDGTLWATGENLQGQLGNGTYTNRNVFEQVGTDTDWVNVVCFNTKMIATKTNGSIWFCGTNGNGGLGNGTVQTGNIGINTLQQVGTDTDWKKVMIGTTEIIALKQNGTIWTWGLNVSGNCGDGTFLPHYLPTQMGTDNNWEDFYTASGTLALKTNGTIWTWGNNQFGTLGNGTTVANPTPTQVGTDTDWQKIYPFYWTGLAKKQNGTFYRWGSNYYHLFNTIQGFQDLQLTPIIYNPDCVLSTEDIEDIQAVSVYPNPTNGLFTLQYSMTGDELVDISVINILGQKIYNKQSLKTVLDYQDQINLSNQPTGLYMVTFQTSNKVTTVKLIKN